MIKIKVNNFNLKDRVTCGQIFRFIEENDSFIIILKDRVVKLKQENDNLYVTSNNEENLENVIKYYLDLNRDYEKINNKIILNNPDLKSSIEKSNGLKMIQQDKFETIISYIISANNRVPMISKDVNLAQKHN